MGKIREYIREKKKRFWVLVLLLFLLLVIFWGPITGTGPWIFVFLGEGGTAEEPSVPSEQFDLGDALWGTIFGEEEEPWILDENQTNETEESNCPASCNDDNVCTSDYCSVATNYTCMHDPVTPCCGNSVCEVGSENAISCPADCDIGALEIGEFFVPSGWSGVVTKTGTNQFTSDLNANTYKAAYVSATIGNVWNDSIEDLAYSFKCYEAGVLKHSTTCRASGSRYKGVTIIDSYYQCPPTVGLPVCDMSNPFGIQNGWKSGCEVDTLYKGARMYFTSGFSWVESGGVLGPHKLSCILESYSQTDPFVADSASFEIEFT